MNTLTGEVLTLPKMSGSVATPKSLSGNVGAKTINIGGKGEDGATFIPSVSDDGIISWTNDKDLPNPDPVNIMGEKGAKGEDGYTPQKGVDYFTEEDKAEIVEEVIAEIEIPEDNGGKVQDVQINDASVVDESGVAKIPQASSSDWGIVRVGTSGNGEMHVGNTNGRVILRYPVTSSTGLKNRKGQGTQYGGVIDASNFDLAVKIAMTDGEGAAWTETEQEAARARMGAVSLEEVIANLPIYDGEVIVE